MNTFQDFGVHNFKKEHVLDVGGAPAGRHMFVGRWRLFFLAPCPGTDEIHACMYVLCDTVSNHAIWFHHAWPPNKRYFQ